jgi:hypothetical protein
MNSLINNSYRTDDKNIAVTRLSYCSTSSSYVQGRKAVKNLFVKGPIPLDWLTEVALLPGKCLNVAMAIQWLLGMSGGRPVNLTKRAEMSFNVSGDTSRECLNRLEAAGLIQLDRSPGKRPLIKVIVKNNHVLENN